MWKLLIFCVLYLIYYESINYENIDLDSSSSQLPGSYRMGQVCSTGVQIFSGDNGIGVMEMNGNGKNNNNRQSSVTVNKIEASVEATIKKTSSYN